MDLRIEIKISWIRNTALNTDPHSQSGSGSRRAQSMRIYPDPDPSETLSGDNPNFHLACSKAGLQTLVVLSVQEPSNMASFCSSYSLRTKLKLCRLCVLQCCGSMPLTNGSGSFYFHHWPSRCQQTNLKKKVFCKLFFEGTFTSLIKGKK